MGLTASQIDGRGVVEDLQGSVRTPFLCFVILFPRRVPDQCMDPSHQLRRVEIADIVFERMSELWKGH